METPDRKDKNTGKEAVLDAANRILAWAKDLAQGCPDHPEYHPDKVPNLKCQRCLMIWAHSDLIEGLKQHGLITGD